MNLLNAYFMNPAFLVLSEYSFQNKTVFLIPIKKYFLEITADSVKTHTMLIIGTALRRRILNSGMVNSIACRANIDDITAIDPEITAIIKESESSVYTNTHTVRIYNDVLTLARSLSDSFIYAIVALSNTILEMEKR